MTSAVHFKALDCRSDEDVRAGSIPITSSFFFFLMMMVEQVRSTKPEGAKRPRMRMQSTKLEGAKRPRMRAQSLRARSDRVDVP